MIVDVTFTWDDRFGSCHDCGRPAAYEAVDCYGVGRHERLCSVCTAQWAADGHTDWRWLFADPDDEEDA